MVIRVEKEYPGRGIITGIGEESGEAGQAAKQHGKTPGLEGPDRLQAVWRGAAKLYLAAFACLLLGMMLADLAGEERLFSERENRLLQQKPDFTWQGLWEGSWGRDYEAYLTDQFPGRDRWIGVKALSGMAIGRKDINGVYPAADGYLIERHAAGEIDGAAAGRKLVRLQSDMETYREILGERMGADKAQGCVRAMLVPTAGMILADKLPPYAGEFDQLAYISRIGPERIPVEQTLKEHAGEDIYYRTDHHWTTLGAYYGYTAWAEGMGIEPVRPEDWERRTVSGSFRGTLEAKLGLPVRPDSIEIFEPKESSSYSYEVRYDMREETADSLYAWSHLDTRNQYGVFLDDNHALVEIRTRSTDGPEAGAAGGNRALLIIKDSYANCFVPFLTAHYDTIYMIDKRYYRGKAADYLAEHEEIGGVLILYDVIHFIENY